MHLFKSSPQIQQCEQKAQRVCKKESNLHIKEPEYKIANPFRSGKQLKFIPYQLKEQIQVMQYISPASITNISFPTSLQSQRRSSNFNRLLMLMQEAARKQEEKFHGLLTKMNQQGIEQSQTQMVQEQIPLNLPELDNLSIDMENCFNQSNQGDFHGEQFGLFGETFEPNSQDLFFYSQTDLLPQISNDFECFFDS